jgi:hypothetical protein
MTFPILLFIMLIHWLADFCLQTDEQAQKKSVDPKWLFYHVLTYTLVWLLASYYLFGDDRCLIFAGVTFVAHFATDSITSRIGKTFWDKKDFHNGFNVVGFDQILHHSQLFLTYMWLATT